MQREEGGMQPSVPKRNKPAFYYDVAVKRRSRRWLFLAALRIVSDLTTVLSHIKGRKIRRVRGWRESGVEM